MLRHRRPGCTTWTPNLSAPFFNSLLDWDYAHPAPPVQDVAYALEYVAPFRDDETCLRWLGYPVPPDRRRRLALFADSYGLLSTSGLVDAVLRVQEQGAATVRRLAAEGHEPQVTWVREGYLDNLEARIRWSEENRSLFE